MSTTPDADFDLELHFLPAWAQKSSETNRYAQYNGPMEREDRKHDRPPRRRDQNRGPGQPRPEGGSRPSRRDDRSGSQNRNWKPAPIPVALPELDVAFVPDDKGVDSLTRQIKMTGRAYPLFHIAQMILQKPERYSVIFRTKKKEDGQTAQPLFICALDDSLWLSEEEAIRHVLGRHFATFYMPEKIQIDPPKGTYTFVAQCGLSGFILGPPNYHDYQHQLRKLHAERFSRMPFDAYKSKVKIVRDDAVVKKWIEEQSWKTEYSCLNLPEPLKLGSREETEKHFREAHLSNIVKAVETFQLGGAAARNLRSPDLARLVRHAWEEQRRFPLQIATVLSQQFASHGLHFFKVNKTVTHVAVARPCFLDLVATPVSNGVKRIIDFINATPKCQHKRLIQVLTPVPVPVEGAAAVPESPAEPTPEMTAVLSDLHWLIHQGHVIEFANGILETAKKPLPKPVKSAPATLLASDSAGVLAVATLTEAGATVGTQKVEPTETSQSNEYPLSVS